MNNEPPTLEEWRALYVAADEFARLAPWVWMSDIDLFGVKSPETGKIGYCCVMGNGGQVFGLNLYLGPEGLTGYWAMAHAGDKDIDDIGAAQRCIALSMEDRENLRPKDLATIKSLGLKFRGRLAWPMFYSMEPGYAAWYLSGYEAHFLTVALQQACDIAPRFRDNPDLLPESLDSGIGHYLVRVPQPEPEGYRWTDSVQPAPHTTETKVVDVSYDKVRVKNLMETLGRTDGVLEIDFVVTPIHFGEKDERPWIPGMVMLVDAGQGYVFDVKFVPLKDAYQECVDRLLNTFEKIHQLPRAIHVRRPMLFGSLRKLCKTMGIECVERKRLPQLQNAHKALMKHGFG